jgi:hypothetical protein
MRLAVPLVASLFLLGCTADRQAVRVDSAAYAAPDYLRTAYEALNEAETDVDGRRVAAQLQTKQALRALPDGGLHARRVPYEGPPTLDVAAELLERSTLHLSERDPARAHAQRALRELRGPVP